MKKFSTTALLLLAIFLLGAALALCLLKCRHLATSSTTDASFMTTQRGHLARLDRASLPGRVVFLGSSTFQGLDVSSVTPHGLNLGLGGDSSSGLQQRMQQYQSLTQARAVVINIGFNDLMRHCKAPAITPRALLAVVPDGIPVFVLGLQHVDLSLHRERCQGQLNELVDGYNSILAAHCAERVGCTYIPNPVNGDHNMSGLREADGIHLSPDGYRLLIDRLRQALVQLDADFASEQHP